MSAVTEPFAQAERASPDTAGRPAAEKGKVRRSIAKARTAIAAAEAFIPDPSKLDDLIKAAQLRWIAHEEATIFTDTMALGREATSAEDALADAASTARDTSYRALVEFKPATLADAKRKAEALRSEAVGGGEGYEEDLIDALAADIASLGATATLEAEAHVLLTNRVEHAFNADHDHEAWGNREGLFVDAVRALPLTPANIGLRAVAIVLHDMQELAHTDGSRQGDLGKEIARSLGHDLPAGLPPLDGLLRELEAAVAAEKAHNARPEPVTNEENDAVVAATFEAVDAIFALPTITLKDAKAKARGLLAGACDDRSDLQEQFGAFGMGQRVLALIDSLLDEPVAQPPTDSASRWTERRAAYLSAIRAAKRLEGADRDRLFDEAGREEMDLYRTPAPDLLAVIQKLELHWSTKYGVDGLEDALIARIGDGGSVGEIEFWIYADLCRMAGRDPYPSERVTLAHLKAMGCTVDLGRAFVFAHGLNRGIERVLSSLSEDRKDALLVRAWIEDFRDEGGHFFHDGAQLVCGRYAPLTDKGLALLQRADDDPDFKAHVRQVVSDLLEWSDTGILQASDRFMAEHADCFLVSERADAA